jgi:hypothetical protein
MELLLHENLYTFSIKYLFDLVLFLNLISIKTLLQMQS